MEGRQGRAKPALREAALAADRVKVQDKNSAFPGPPQEACGWRFSSVPGALPPWGRPSPHTWRQGWHECCQGPGGGGASLDRERSVPQLPPVWNEGPESRKLRGFTRLTFAQLQEPCLASGPGFPPSPLLPGAHLGTCKCG